MEIPETFKPLIMSLLGFLSEKTGIPLDDLLKILHEFTEPGIQTEAILDPRPSCTFLRDNIKRIRTVKEAEEYFGLGTWLYYMAKRSIEAEEYITLHPEKDPK